MTKVKKISNTKYEFRLYGGIDDQTGKKIYYHRTFETKKEATLALSRLQLEIEKRGAIEKDNNVLFETVYHEWYEQYINTVRESTYARTAKMFDNHILPKFGDKRIRTITINQVQSAVNEWFRDVTYNYKRWYNYTVAVFEFAIRRGYMNGKNPAKLITMPQKSDKAGNEIENFWSKAELQQFFKLIDPVEDIEKYTLFRLLAFGGLRRGELLALTWNDLNLKDNTLRINKTLTQGLKGHQIVNAPKTKKSRRTIVLDNTTVNLLKSWRVAQKRKFLLLGINTMSKDQLMFSTYKNTHKVLNCPAKWLKLIIKDTDLKPITIHGFRHSHASAMFSAGATIKEVQERLGHEDVSTTLNIYTHVTKDQNTTAVKKLVNYLNF